MHKRKLACRRKEDDILGASGSTGGGGDVLLLPELGGTFRRVAGGLVKVSRGLNWAEGGYAGWLLVGLILDRMDVGVCYRVFELWWV